MVATMIAIWPNKMQRQLFARGRVPGFWFVLLLLFESSIAALPMDLAVARADRAAIEHVYYLHRLGQKPPFEEVLPAAALEKLVRSEILKESVLLRAYGLAITSAMLDAEVSRINTTTRAPEMLAEIKVALGNDSDRFANGFAKPILVERILREKFGNDDSLHAPQRNEIERIRSRLTNAAAAFREKGTLNKASESPALLVGASGTNEVVATLLGLLKESHAGSFSEMKWQMGSRGVETNVPPFDEIKKRFGPDAVVLSGPGDAGKQRELYFADLPGELQNVLRAQLRKAGDLSAVIETPSHFLLYVTKEKTEAELSVAAISISKRSYEKWIEEQAGAQ